MKTFDLRQFLCLVTLALSLLLFGCNVIVSRSPVPSSTALPSPSKRPSTPELPTLTPLPTSITQTPTATSRPTLTPTLAPTLSADEEKTVVLSLLQDNAGCRLPCWWGFTPGETKWQAAQTFFLSLGKEIPSRRQKSGATSYGVTFHVPQHGLELEQSYIVRADETIEMISLLVLGSPDFEEEFAQDLGNYLLSQLLATYGQPSEVLLRTYLDPEGMYPFHLLLYYPEQGIMVRYIDLAERDGEILRFCPKQPGITLWLWSPERRMTIMDIAITGVEGFPEDEVAYFRPIDEVTEMSIERFYQTFAQSADDTCLETPADLW
jgi:hypothetical protein